jgi:hypothetical protein
VPAGAFWDREWPAVRTRLDGGQHVPLGLIKDKCVRPRDLAKQHQVLTYGYDVDAGTVVAWATLAPVCPTIAFDWISPGRSFQGGHA